MFGKILVRVLFGAVLLGSFVGVNACGSSTNNVDGKAVVEVPDAAGNRVATCYLLEVERKDSRGEEVGESYVCVSKAEWDRNNVGEEWVDSSGVKRR